MMKKEYSVLENELECKVCSICNRSPKVSITDDYRVKGLFCCETFLNEHEHYIGELQELYDTWGLEKRLLQYPKTFKVNFEN